MGGLAGDDDRTRGFSPRALDAVEASLAEFSQMGLHPLDITIAVRKIAAGPQKIVDRPIAGEDLFRVPQIVEGDRRDREVERTADSLGP
jgi:hypothetical protein